MKILPSLRRGPAVRGAISRQDAYPTVICCGSSWSRSVSLSWQLCSANSPDSELYLTRMKRIALGLLVLLFLGRPIQPAPKENPGVWLDVPFVKQSEDGCGSAVISMVLQYWNAHGSRVEPRRTDAAAIQRLLYSGKARGIYASDIESYLKGSGFRHPTGETCAGDETSSSVRFCTDSYRRFCVRLRISGRSNAAALSSVSQAARMAAGILDERQLPQLHA